MAETQRERAARDPYWAVSLDRMDSGVAGIVKNLHALFQRSPLLKNVFFLGSGWRTGSVEHNSGRAIDLVITASTGRAPTAAERAAALEFVRWVVANGKRLGVQWVLFSLDNKVTWSYNMDRGSWVKLADRGSVSGNHRDHVHIYFKKGATWPSALNTAVVGGAAKPDPATPTPKPPVKVWDGKSFPGVTLFRDGIRSDAARVLQERLKVHGYDPGPIDSYFGPKTRAATKKFQLAQHWTGKGADGIPGPKTWERLMSAPKTKTPAVSAADIRRMATEVIDGKHGNGHAQRRQSLGVTAMVYEKVRAEVNRRV